MTDERTDWLAWRRGGVGASDVAAAAHGLYGGAYGVVHSKLTGAESDIDPALAERGHRWERPMAIVAEQLAGVAIVGEQAWCEHPEHGWRRCTVDGLTAPAYLDEHTLDNIDGVLEIKTVGLHSPRRWDAWETQCQWQMHVTGTPRALLVVAVIDETGAKPPDVRTDWVEADAYRQAELVDLAQALWDHVDAGTYPPPDTPDALPLVKARHAHRDDDAPSVELGTVVGDLAARLHELRRLATELDKEKDVVEARLREAIAEHGEAFADTDDGQRWRIRCGKTVRRFTDMSEAEMLDRLPHLGKTVLDRERAKAEEPDLYEALKHETDQRALTLKPMNQETNR